MSKRVAIIGVASTSIRSAPWSDPDINFWTIASLQQYWPDYASRINIWFEIHPNFNKLRPDWLPWAIEHQPNVFLAKEHPELKYSQAYPIEAVLERFGRYFTSSVSYMLAIAIMEEVDWIGLYGVDMAAASEYYDQRPCCEYLIGMARGMGIEVEIPEASPLLKSPWLYGYNDKAKTPKNRERDELANWRSVALALRDRWDPSFPAEKMVQKANGGLAVEMMERAEG